MQIEMFFDDLGFISSFRHSWSKNPTHQPNRKNVYNIKKYDFKKLVEFIVGGTAYIADRPPEVVGNTNRVDLDLGQLKLNKADYDNMKKIRENKKNDFLSNKF